MNFGASPSDVIDVVAFCRALHRKCRDAGAEYDEVRDEVRGLHTVLKHLKYEVEAPESPLNHDRSLWVHQLAPLVGDCDLTLKHLDDLLQKYGRVSNGSNAKGTRAVRDQGKLGSDEMDTLGSIRVKLISHQTSLTSCLDTIQLHPSGKMATTLDNQEGQLDVILDKVDAIAARMGQRSGGILTGHEDDDKEVWKQFRQELITEGFSDDVLTQHKDVLRAYIREIDQQGLLDEAPPQLLMPAQQPVANTQHWLHNMHPSPATSERGPPTFDSLNAPTDDGSTKEMVVREENMKFPQAMKFERRKPETWHNDLQRLDSLNFSKGITPRTTPAVPKLITSNEKDIQYYNTDGSSDEDSESEGSSRGRHMSLIPSKGPQMAVVVMTCDLFKTLSPVRMNQGLKLTLPPSPTSFRSSQGSFGEEDALRSIAIRPKNPAEFASSPSRTGAVPIPATNPRYSNESFGTSPQPETIRLAPDEHGNEIPPNANWTKINRRLVSPEVLEQDHRRYEARPEWVAVLGVLTRAEIEAYAARTSELRRRRNQAAFPKEIPPPQPPRPSVLRTNSNPHTGRETPSTTDSESSDSTHRRHRSRNRPGRSYTPSEINTPVSGYPNPFGQPIPIQGSHRGPPSPNLSPSSSISHPVWMASPPKHLSAGAVWVPAQGQKGGMYYPPKEKERERQRSSRRHYSHDSHSKSSHSGRDRERERERHKEKKPQPPPQKVSRWKENLTAAGIGGAAVSLLNVLSEAAEGL